jgi:hypothetical protein
MSLWGVLIRHAPAVHKGIAISMIRRAYSAKTYSSGAVAISLPEFWTQLSQIWRPREDSRQASRATKIGKS